MSLTFESKITIINTVRYLKVNPNNFIVKSIINFIIKLIYNYMNLILQNTTILINLFVIFKY